MEEIPSCTKKKMKNQKERDRKKKESLLIKSCAQKLGLPKNANRGRILTSLLSHLKCCNKTSNTTSVAILNSSKNTTFTEYPLTIASRNHYTSRHSLDGRIIYVDMRISFVAEYLSEEVLGSIAFDHMHVDDRPLVEAALRQMYYGGQSYAQSTYRLKTKSGRFIYLQTQGFLDPSMTSNTHHSASITCVNYLLSEEEGKKAIKAMREKYSAYIYEKSDIQKDAIQEAVPKTSSPKGDGMDTESGLPESAHPDYQQYLSAIVQQLTQPPLSTEFQDLTLFL